MPSYARKGYAKALMRRVHEQMIEDGIDMFVLTTSKILVAYDMYPKLGYKEMIPLTWGIKKREKHPAGEIRLKVNSHAVEDGDRLFQKIARGNLGFVHRPKGYPKHKCAWGPHYSKAVSLSRGGKPIGYAYVRQPEGFLNIRELVCPDPDDYGPCMRALENRFASRYVTRSLVTRHQPASEFLKHGFTDAETWGMFMAMDAKGKMSQRQLKTLLGIDKDRFQMFAIDTY
jgi:predicted acetyltransferase